MTTGMQQVSRAMTDFGSTMTWGSPSPETWRRYCNDSMVRSRRRRARERDHSRGAGFVASVAVIGLLFLLGFVAFTVVWLVFL